MPISFLGNSFLVVSVLVFVTFLLFFEALYLVWRAQRGPEARKLNKRLHALSATSDRTSDTRLLRQRMLSDLPTIERYLQSMKSDYLAFALAGAVLGALGQVSFKQGAIGRVAGLDFVNPWIFLGLTLYMAGTVLWIYALSIVPLTTLYPFTALTYVLVNLLAVTFLGEQLSTRGILGTGLVLLGLFLVAGDPGRISWVSCPA